MIFHITGRKEWEEALSKGYYEATSLAAEGFIHCSEAGQVAGVLARYFKDKTDLVKLSIDTSRLNAELKYEFSPPVNEVFPHIYGPVNLDAITEISTIPLKN